MKVAAVVVTYNRLNALKECIDALRNQTRPVDKIIVVNNGSTDGTEKWLKQQKDLYVITQENLGSGGGQYTGIKTAFEMGYDWIWTMDDDGKPENITLEKLLEYSTNEIEVLHPMVVSYEDPNILSFGCWILENSNRVLFKTIKELKKVYPNKSTLPSLGCPFNGTLFNREIIKKVGLPRSELFIWGEEREYLHRIYHTGVASKIVLSAIFYHPPNKLLYNIFDSEKKDWWKIYYLVRNKIAILEVYYKSPFVELKFIKSIFKIFFYIIRKRENLFFKIKIILLAGIHGLIRKFGKYEINTKIINSKI